MPGRYTSSSAAAVAAAALLTAAPPDPRPRLHPRHRRHAPRRVATNLQSTPIAITAVTAESLQERGITNVGDLTSVVPNSQFRRVQGAFGPGVSSFIRGIGSGDTGLAGEPAVAFYIDDIYYPILLGANFDLLDVDHIEVLRGPQGTLFGRNSLAGALNVVGKQPSTTETTGYAEVTAGQFERRDVRAGFNLPLSENAALDGLGPVQAARGLRETPGFHLRNEQARHASTRRHFSDVERARHQLPQLHGE